MSNPREFDTDALMRAEYDDMHNEVSDRKRVALELQQERSANNWLRDEISLLQIHVQRLENERDYYKSTSHFQGP